MIRPRAAENLNPVSPCILICCAFLLCMGCSSTEQANAPGSSTSQAPEHVRKLPPLFLDKAEGVHEQMPVTNETGKTVHFTSIRYSCACAGAKLAKMDLDPGEATTLNFDIDFHGRSGQQRFTTRLVEDNGQEWPYVIEIRLYRRGDFDVGDQLHFGAFDQGETKEREAIFRLYGENRSEIPAAPVFSADVKELKCAPGSESVEELPDGVVVKKIPIKLTLNANGSGPNFTTLRAAFMHHGQKQEAICVVDWAVRPGIVATPSVINFGTLGSGAATTTQRVFLKRSDRQPFAVTSLGAVSSSLSCAAKKTDDPSVWLIELTLDPKLLTGFISENLEIQTDYTTQSTLKIPVLARRRE